MSIVVLGLSHKTAPVDIRERFAFPEDALLEVLRLLGDKEEVLECVVLSTCNRVEIYALMSEPEGDVLKGFLCEYHGFDGDIDQHLYLLTNKEAVKHLSKVASGLDSMVTGEPQIFKQVKEAYNKALEAETVGPVLRSLFPQIFGVAKKVRSATGIGRHNVSVSYAAVKLARDIFSDLGQKAVMMLGAGEMGEATLRNLMSNGVRDVFVSNRTFRKAVELAQRCQGTPIMFYEVPEYMPKADILISSVSTRGYVLKAEDVAKVSALRKPKPMFLIDISVPRSIAPEVNEIDDVHLYNIDDLRAVAEASTRMRKKEADKANRIISGKTTEIMRSLNTQEILPIILSLKAKAEQIRKEGFDDAAAKLSLSDGDKALVESLTKSISKSILHQAMVEIRKHYNELAFRR